jgi:hypothetical protein
MDLPCFATERGCTMAIKEYNAQQLYETIPGEGNVIETLLSNWRASVAQELHLTNNSNGIQSHLRPTTPEKGRLKNQGGDDWQLSDFILFVAALITMFFGFVLFKQYRVLTSELQESGA